MTSVDTKTREVFCFLGPILQIGPQMRDERK